MAIKLQNIVLSASLCSTAVFAGEMGPTHQHPEGFFIGLGGNYNALGLDQESSGSGLSDLYVNSVYTSRGIAAGTAAPFKNTTLGLAPEIRAGYLKNLNNDLYYGVKFNYQYLGLTATNRDLYLPQSGELQNFNPPSTSSMFGYAIADSVETSVTHNMNLFALIGEQFDNASVYIGAGPSLMSIRSKNYNSIGYAIVNGQTLNVTGLVNYGSPTLWAWGGGAQVGMNYFVTPTWFFDVSYTYSVVGSRSSTHEQSFSNTTIDGPNTILTTGILATKEVFRTTSLQSVNLSINKLFDI